ncbi:MAG: DUF2510 domain-containing protein [Microbacteriaceae bacterium]
MGVLPTPGWYDDPTDSAKGQRRWWSGESWTEFLEEPAVAAASAAPDSTAPESRAEALAYGYEYGYGADADADAADAGAGAEADAYEPMVRRRPEEIVFRDIPSRWSTASVWFIALVPLLSFVAALFLVTVAWASNFNLWVIGAALLVLQLLPIVWAYRDRARLDSFGYSEPANWAWVLLGPLAYLVARTVVTRREARVGAAPLVTYLAVSILLSVSTFAIVAFAPSFVNTTVERSAEDRLEADLLAAYGTTLSATRTTIATSLGSNSGE